jgi:hypothetical protein
MEIVNETFESYRQEVHRIDDAMRLLVSYKYKIIDLENQLIDSSNIHRHTEREHKRLY